MFCNFNPLGRKHIPVLITNDYVYWAGGMIFPLVGGYLTSLLMMYAPQQVEGKYAGTASMLSALILVIGKFESYKI
jgi:equilibrative nucleoside transporter 1/2/3